MRGGRRAGAARLKSVCSHLQPTDRLHVLQTLENRLTPALPVEVGLQRRRGVQGTQGLPPAVLVVTPRPGAVQLHTLQGLELFAIGGAKKG